MAETGFRPMRDRAERAQSQVVTTMTQVRPLPPNTVLPVKGTSFRQETVRTTVEGDEVRVRHDTTNPHDPNACVVETLTGDPLGFIPKDLAVRLAVPHPGGRWRARITEVYRKETWGLRLQLGPLVVEGIRERAGAGVPGLRHHGDGVAEFDGVIVAVDEPAPGEDVGPADATVEAAAAPTVFAKSGRALGRLVSRTDTHVKVQSASGGTVTYPASVVRVA